MSKADNHRAENERDPKRGKISRVRILLVLLLAAVSLFAGHTVYYRNKIDTQLQSALSKIDDQPLIAYQQIEDVLLLRYVPTFGYVEHARQVFFDALQDSIVHELLHAKHIRPQVYEHAVRAAQIIKTYSETSGEDLMYRHRMIAQAVRDSAQRLKDYGTLTAWDQMMIYFKDLSRNDLLPTEIFDDFDAWMAEQDRVSRRELGIRDCIYNASNDFYSALEPLWPSHGARASASSGYLPVPPMIGGRDLLQASSMFEKSIAGLTVHRIQFRLEEEPEVLWPIYTLIHHNLNSLKIGHLVDYGAGAPVFGTEFISESVLPVYMNEVPTTQEQYESFLRKIRLDLELMDAFLERETPIDEEIKAQYRDLHQHNWKLYEEIEEKFLNETSGDTRSITLARPQLIVQFPPM